MTDEAEDYEFDVFFSYKRHGQTAEWTWRVQQQLNTWLTFEIGRPARIFFDIDTLELGDSWPEKLKRALAKSRFMVSVWSPLYFQSAWCVSEWKSFLQREENLNLRAHGLIVPVRFHDGDRFPVRARETQSMDLTSYASCLSAFWESQRALELERKLKELAVATAEVIRTAPAFREDWPIVEAVPEPALKIPLGRL